MHVLTCALQSLKLAISSALLNKRASHPGDSACRVSPIQVAVRAFLKEMLPGNVPAVMKEDPSHEDLMEVPPGHTSPLATWLTEKVKFLGSDLMSSLPDKVIFCQALLHTAWGCCQVQARARLC